MVIINYVIQQEKSNFVTFQDVWWVNILITTHYNSIQTVRGFRFTGDTWEIPTSSTWRVPSRLFKSRSTGFLCEIHGGTAEMLLSVWITIGGELANHYPGDNTETLCIKGLVTPLQITCALFHCSRVLTPDNYQHVSTVIRQPHFFTIFSSKYSGQYSTWKTTLPWYIWIVFSLQKARLLCLWRI